ncbi:MAG: flippase-like domain-containing protein [Candidatus Aenigmarchaeota archaeon]|nr:flippase-like domain-containing protein [Candidatus Aenigmarchaeota archaeon]
MKNRLADALLFLVAAGLLSALILHSNPAAIAKTLSKSNPVFVGGALTITSAIILVKIIRWKIILESIKIKLSAAQVAGPYTASLFVSNITPGRVGEPIRSYYLKKSLGHPIANTLPSVLLERLLDISTLMFFYLSGLVLLYSIVDKILAAAALVVAFAVGSVIFFAGNKKLLRATFDKIYNLLEFIPKIRELAKRAEKLPEKFHAGFVLASKSKHVPKLILITLFTWVMEFFIVKLSFLSIGVDMGFLIIASVCSIATVIGLLTFLPGNIGSFEATAALLFTQVVPGMDLATATSGVIIYRISSLWFALLLSLKSFIKYQYS